MKINALSMEKKLFLLILGIVLMMSSPSLAGGSIPNMIGKWQGKATTHGKVHGFESLTPMTFVIEEQKGRIFKGRKEWKARGKQYTEGFSGVISQDNTKVYIAEHEGGTDIGEIISKDQIALHYLKEGRNASAALYELKRIK